MSEVGVRQKDTEEAQKSFGHVEAPPADELYGARKLEAEDEEEHGGAEPCPAVGEPRWAWHMCDHQGGSKGFKLFEVVAIVTEGAAHTIDFCRNCYNEMASEARRSRGERCLLEGVGGAEVFLRQGICSVWYGRIPAKNVGAIHSQECVGQNGFGRRSESDAIGEQTEGGNTRRRARRNSSFCCTALTCASMAHQCAKQTMLRCQAMVECSWKMANSAHGQVRR